MGKREKPLLPDTIAPSWLVVQALGTAAVVVVLLTASESDPWIWTAYGVSGACWLGFVAASPSFPREATGLLAVASIAPSIALGWAEDSSAIVLAVVTVSRFATLTEPSVAAIMGVVGLDASLAAVTGLVAGAAGPLVFGNVGVLLVLMLLGLNRRQYEVQAVQAAELLEQTKLAQSEHARAAALDERTRIAREIHDVLAHSLGALGVHLEVAEALLAEKSDVDGALDRVRSSRKLAADGLAEARDAVAALRSDVPSLAGALRQLAGAHQGRVTFEVVGEQRPLPSAAVVSLAGVAREALTNAAKHAYGRPVSLRLHFAEAEVRLRVWNEIGETVRSEDTGGFGLTGMRERLALAGGTLTAGPGDGRWTVEAVVRA
ncbi:sensor histidine kinase [Amycolatopsis keratiniphila]|uniref:histidine kinase n=1 Tax=Amycolatopsis keratiniphila subsp. keratiniphila TaxID=227715 RepID=A0A1W2LRN2_9PSEU|nr:histidine kinase [Amycolatopsis keratiniphila]OLZ56304.1 sensor histidine kinase [Amycolatopsis keratiniphila subsp. nogabecina]ONF66991.1 sensor histidine kinase [Amycolatopsis keratiniphila subsp. keratiniphila]SDU53158.1 Signal transduction histidine kinase [Amycolatopsis keratiniphila]